MTKMKNKYDWREILFLISVCIIPLANFLIFYVYMNFDSLLLAFKTTKGNNVSWGFENFRLVFQRFGTSDGGKDLLIAIRNTGMWCLVNIFMNIPIMLTTYFIYKKMVGNKFVTFMSVFPGLLPGAAYTGFILWILQPAGAYGFLKGEWFNEFALPLLTHSDYANKTMVFLTIWGSIGINLVWSGAMHGIDPEILEAGKIDGTNWFNELTRIIIPLMWPTLSVSIMFLVAGILGSSGPILLYTNGAYDTQTLSFWIFSQVTYSGNYELPATLGLLMSCFSIPLVFIVRHFAEKVEVY